MNGFGEYPFVFLVDDHDTFKDDDFTDGTNEYGKIVELLDVGCDARPPPSLSSQDMKERYRTTAKRHKMQREYLENASLNGGDWQSLLNGNKRTRSYWKEVNKQEKSHGRENPAIRNIDDRQKNSLWENIEMRRRVGANYNDDPNIMIEEMLYSEKAPSEFMYVGDDFMAETEHCRRGNRWTRNRTIPKMSKLKTGPLYENLKHKADKSVNESNPYTDTRESVFSPEDYKKFKDCAVDKDSLSSGSKLSISSTSIESCAKKGSSRNNLTLSAHASGENPEDVNGFQKRMINRNAKKNHVKPNSADKAPIKKSSRVDPKKANNHYNLMMYKDAAQSELKIKNRSMIAEDISENQSKAAKNFVPVGKDRRQMFGTLGKLVNTYSPNKQRPPTKSRKNDSEVILNLDGKRYKRKMNLGEDKKENSCIASRNSILPMDEKRRKRSRVPIRIGGPIKVSTLTQKLNVDERKEVDQKDRCSKNVDLVRIGNAETANKELQGDEAKLRNKQEAPEENNRGDSSEATKVTTELSESFGDKDTGKNTETNIASKWQEVHFKRRAVDLKVFNMAKAAREQRKREFARCSLKDNRKKSKDEPREILDISINLLEKNVKQETPMQYVEFEKLKSDVHTSKVTGRKQ